MNTLLEKLRAGIEVRFPKITRTTLSLFAGASGDHHPVHIDTDFARASGYEDVFAHGGLTVSLIMNALIAQVPQGNIRSMSTRFLKRTPIGAEPRCRILLTDLKDLGDQQLATVSVNLYIQTDVHAITGTATLVVNPV